MEISKEMAHNVIESARRLSGISKMADESLIGGVISKEEHGEIKAKVRKLELDNLFAAMAFFCK